MQSIFIVLIIVGFFGLIVLGVILVRKYVKPFKNTEKPKSEKEIAQEEVARLTQELDQNEFEQAKELNERKKEKPTEEEAIEEELARVTKPVENEEAIKQMEEYSEEHNEEK